MIKRIRSLCIWAIALVMVALAANPASAEPGIGQPAPAQIDLQGAVTPVMEEIVSFHHLVNVIIIAIAIFVMILLLVVIFRYNATANPTPSSFSHNTVVEVLWTVGPILILVFIGIYSFKLLFLQYEYPPPDLTIKATGNAWYWEHSYPDQDFKVTSTMVRDEDVLRAKMGDDAFDKKYGALEGMARINALYKDAKPVWVERGLVRQLSVDNEIAIPVNKVVHLLVTSNDVIHAWTVPSFGSKLDAVPGRTAATWFKATRTGVYYGQCSVLCGRDHSSMPIAVRVVDEAAFKNWVAAAKARKWDDARKILQAATSSDTQPKFALVQPPKKQLANQ